MKNIAPLFLLLLLFSCTKTPEELFQNAIIEYNTNQDPEARIIIEENYFSTLKAVEVEIADTYLAGHNCIILKSNAVTTIITSDGYKEPWSDDILYAYYDPQTQTLCTSDGYKAEFFIFSKDEQTGEQNIARLKTIELSDDEETTIDAFYVYNNTLYYFFKRRIYSADTVTGETTNIFPELTFPPPFTKEQFRVSLSIKADHLAVNIGNAGSYHLSLFSLSTKKSLFHNKKTNSFFYALLDDSVYYIGGKTGAWIIYRYPFTSQTPEPVKEFTSLKDISISGETVFYVDADDFHITGINFKSQISEKPLYPIKRLINDYLLIEHNRQLYLVKTKNYFDTNRHFEQLVPEFFEVDEISAEELTEEMQE
ncbi:MAG: hypothetical protein PF637_06230 [Spirochaetes bacterium]|jgi:hypothetical protein|nr:hypothetical protein [Spirochaetota bacterium]